jgi:hypothetical protein
VIICSISFCHVDDVFMRLLLPAFAVEQNDRPFVSLDRSSGFWLTAFQLLFELYITVLIRRPDCLIGRPDSNRAPYNRSNRSRLLATKWQLREFDRWAVKSNHG